MDYNVRIDDNFLRGDHVDGEVLQHTTLNELEKVIKTAINANYEDIQKLQDGTLSVNGALSVIADDGVAVLSQYATESLQESDTKFPSSLQVKNYVDNAINTANIGLVYYWDGTNTQASLNLFNNLCNMYDNNIPFVLFGRFNVEFEFTDEHDVPYREYRQVVSPIIINKMVDMEEEGNSYTSFITPPIMYWGKYALGSVHLTGEWGAFTDIQPTSWSPSMTPVAGNDLTTAVNGLQTQITSLQNQLNNLVNGDEVEF